jgi:hypothetical protein
MAIHDLRCSDGEFATELGSGVFVGGRHDNEKGNVTVRGSQVGLWSVAGFCWWWLGVGGTAEDPPPRASATRGWKHRTWVVIAIVRQVEGLQWDYGLNGLRTKENQRIRKAKAYQEVVPR